MSLVDGLRYRLRALLGAGRHARDAERELQFHMDLEAAQRRHEGATADEAEFAARRQLGNRTVVAEAMRRMAGLAWLDATRQDLGFALRGLRRTPAFSIVAVVTLALGIGAAAAIYAVINTVLLQPLPIAHGERVLDLEMTLHDSTEAGGREVLWVSVPEYLRWRARLRSFADIGAARITSTVPLGAHTDYERSWWLTKAPLVKVTAVTPNLFGVLGVTPVLGHGFGPADRGTGPQTAVISYRYWQRAYGRDPATIGRTIMLDGTTYTIIGVMPERFVFPEDTQIWTSAMTDIERYSDNEGTLLLDVIGRLRDGVAPAQALTELRTVFASDTAGQPALRHRYVAAPTLRDAMVEEVSSHLAIMTAFVGVLLLIAAANVTNMLLVRATTRRHEIAVRLALGAGRRRIVRQLIVEAVILAAGGAVAGLGAAAAIAQVIAHEDTLALPRRSLVSVDWSVVLAGAIAAVAVGIVCGFIPALSVSRDALETTLRSETARHSAGRGRRRLRDGLVVGQVAMSVVLLAGAGLLVQSVRHLMELRPGITADGVLTGNLEVGYPERDTVARVLAAGRIGEQLRALPNVSDASVATTYPLGGALSFRALRIPGQVLPDSDDAYTTFVGVDRHYFTTLHVRLLRGRAFGAPDFGRRDLAIVNDAMVKKYFPKRDPIGRRIALSSWPTPVEIIGVVEATRSSGGRSMSEPVTYVPLAAEGADNLSIIVRVAHGDPGQMIPAVERAVEQSAPGSRAYGLGPLTTLLRYLAGTPHVYMVIFVGFALAALAVTAVGLYGVISYSVAQRTREIGIRIALGASPNRVRRRVARQGLALTLAGVAAGAALAVVATRILRNMLYGVAPGDPTVLAAVAVLLAAVALLASWLPARRAAAVDPLIAIRTE